MKRSLLATILLGATAAASLLFTPAAFASPASTRPDASWHYYEYYEYLSQCKSEANYLVSSGRYSAAECVVDQPVYDLYVWY